MSFVPVMKQDGGIYIYMLPAAAGMRAYCMIKEGDQCYDSYFL